MIRSGSFVSSILAVILLVTGCHKVPDYVIPPDEMAQLLADIHIGEAVVESNYPDFPTDSTRVLMKQSILNKYGYTFEQLDTSFVWYGHNLKDYRDVYEQTVKILENKLAEAGESEAALRRGTRVGDSVNVWAGSSRYIFREGSPSRFITYSLERTPEWKKGDIYTIRAKFSNTPPGVRWTMMADYSDGSKEILTSRFSGEGWHELTFFVDSLKSAEKFYGSIEFPFDSHGVAVMDSVELIRKPLIPDEYNQRYRQRAYQYYNHN